MIKDPEESFQANIKINVVLNNDLVEYLGRDVTTAFQQYLDIGILLFWEEESLKAIPISRVKEFTLYEEK